MPKELVLNKNINLSILRHYILERIAHVTCPSIISRSFRQGILGGHKRQTALVECVTRIISETVQARDLQEPRKHAKLFHPRQEGGI
jgi:hypothetical protein